MAIKQNELLSLLKDVGLETAKNAVVNKSGTQNSTLTAEDAHIAEIAENAHIIVARKFKTQANANNVNTSSDFTSKSSVPTLKKCEAALYNPETHGCNGGLVFAKCGGTIYDPKTQGCKDNELFELSKCGEILYNPITQECHEGSVLAKCGAVLYDMSIYSCKDNVLLARCGATEFYDPKTQECRFGSVFVK